MFQPDHSAARRSTNKFANAPMALQRSNFTPLQAWFRTANIFRRRRALSGHSRARLVVTAPASSPHKRPADEPGNRQGKRHDCYGDAAAGMFKEAQRYAGFLGVFHDDEFARLPTTSRLPASVESAAIV